MQRIALIGAGRMGLPIVRALVRGGNVVRVLDRDPALEPAVRRVGAVWAKDLDALIVGADVLFTVLPGGSELRAVMLGDGSAGVLARLPRTTVWVDLTSGSPALGSELAAAARARGIAHLDAPMGGGPEGAEDAALTLYVGGDAHLLDQHRALLECFADANRINHCGASGAGYLTKLLINQVWFGQAAALAEALLLGQRAGLSPALLGDLLGRSPAASAFISEYLPALLDGDYLPSFGLDRCVEELESVAAAAAALGTPFAVSGAVTRVYRDALAHFGPINGELLGVAYLEHLAGRRLGEDH